MPALAMKPKAEMQRIIEEPHGLKEDEQAAESAGELKLFRPLANLISGSYAQTKSWNVVGPVIGNLENRVNSMFPETIEKLGNATQPLIENLDKKTAPLAGSMRASLLSRIQNVQDQLQHVSAACIHQKANLYTFANEVVENANATAKPAYEKVQTVNQQLGTKIVDAVSAVTHSIGQIQEVLTPKGASLNRELRSRVHQAILAATHLSSQSATVLKGLSLDVKKKGPRGSAEAVKQALSSSVAFILHAPHEFVLALKEHEQHDNKSPDDEVNRGRAQELVTKMQTLLAAVNSVFVLPFSAAVHAAVQAAELKIEEAEVVQSELELSALKREASEKQAGALNETRTAKETQGVE